MTSLTCDDSIPGVDGAAVADMFCFSMSAVSGLT